MKSTLGEIRRVVREAMGPWVVRAGSHVLVRDIDASLKSWHFTVLQKVTYFSDDELVRKAGRPGDSFNPNWVFERDGKLYAIAERQFFSRPQ